MADDLEKRVAKLEKTVKKLEDRASGLQIPAPPAGISEAHVKMLLVELERKIRKDLELEDEKPVKRTKTAAEKVREMSARDSEVAS